MCEAVRKSSYIYHYLPYEVCHSLLTTRYLLGVLTDTPGQLSNDFFVNLLDMDTVWSASSVTPYLYEGKDAHTGELSK